MYGSRIQESVWRFTFGTKSAVSESDIKAQGLRPLGFKLDGPLRLWSFRPPTAYSYNGVSKSTSRCATKGEVLCGMAYSGIPCTTVRHLQRKRRQRGDANLVQICALDRR
jgi:hypothetical protein